MLSSVCFGMVQVQRVSSVVRHHLSTSEAIPKQGTESDGLKDMRKRYRKNERKEKNSSKRKRRSIKASQAAGASSGQSGLNNNIVLQCSPTGSSKTGELQDRM